MALRKLKDILLDGDNREMKAYRRKLTAYKHKLAKDIYAEDERLGVEENIRLINEKIKEQNNATKYMYKP